MNKIMLTGKAKSDFEKWLEHPNNEIEGRSHFIDTLSTNSTMINIWCIEYFEQLPFSMQFGVYVDWFYSSISYIEFMEIFRDFITDDLRFSTNNLTEARQKAIEKAQGIYNSK